VPQARDDALQLALEAIVAEAADDLPIHRASVALLEADNTLRIAALLAEGPTLLHRDIAYQTTASSLDEVIAQPAEPLVRLVDPDRNPVDALLWEDGIRVHATMPVYQDGRVAGLFSLSSRDPDAFAKTDLSALGQYATRITSLLSSEGRSSRS
jgi:GAF domain-containing protein